MDFVFFIVIVVLLVLLVTKFWPFILAAIILFIAIRKIIQHYQDKKDEKEREIKSEQARIREIERKEKYQEQLKRDAQSCINKLPYEIKKLHFICLEIDKKTSETKCLFEKGAFLPFWKSYSEAVSLTHDYTRQLSRLDSLNSSFKSTIEKIENKKSVQKPSQLLTIPDIEKRAKELSYCRDKAFLSKDFTDVYLQKGLQDLISSKFDSLEAAVEAIPKEINRNLNAIHRAIKDTNGILESARIQG